MSYNIDHIEVTSLDAWMKAKDVIECLDFDLPEVHFLEELEDAANNALIKGKPGARIQLRGFNWIGEGSGSSFESFRAYIAPKIMGKLEAVLTWEGGDSHSGIRVRDGKMSTCDVVMALAPEEPE